MVETRHHQYPSAQGQSPTEPSTNQDPVIAQILNKLKAIRLAEELTAERLKGIDKRLNALEASWLPPRQQENVEGNLQVRTPAIPVTKTRAQSSSTQPTQPLNILMPDPPLVGPKSLDVDLILVAQDSSSDMITPAMPEVQKKMSILTIAPRATLILFHHNLTRLTAILHFSSLPMLGYELPVCKPELYRQNFFRLPPKLNIRPTLEIILTSMLETLEPCSTLSVGHPEPCPFSRWSPTLLS